MWFIYNDKCNFKLKTNVIIYTVILMNYISCLKPMLFAENFIIFWTFLEVVSIVRELLVHFNVHFPRFRALEIHKHYQTVANLWYRCTLKVVLSDSAVANASTREYISLFWFANSTSWEVVFIFNVHDVFLIFAKMNNKCHARSSECQVLLACENEVVMPSQTGVYFVNGESGCVIFDLEIVVKLRPTHFTETISQSQCFPDDL